MLLTHTSGYTYSWYNQHIKRWTDQNVDDIVCPSSGIMVTAKAEGQFRGQHLKMPLVNEPGSKFEYGISMDWAGILVERITNQSLGEYCQGISSYLPRIEPSLSESENIFGPMELKDCAFDLKDRDDLVKRLMPLHQWDTEKNAFTRRDFPRGVRNVPFQSGGGGLCEYLRGIEK